VDGIVLGCTEIPPLLGDVSADTDLLDPLPLLAEAAVERALAAA
jgi:aspartate/glutamate racemase